MGLFGGLLKGADNSKKNSKYPIVPDWDDLSRGLTAFRNSYNDYFKADRILENSEIQKHATQMLWHECYLQKLKMAKLGITMELGCDRRDFGSSYGFKKYIREDKYNDGKYDIDYIFEDVTATLTFYQGGKEVGRFDYDEVANYVVYSAKMTDDHKVLCLNCGAETTRADLIDGCDYCGSKYTVEDLDGRIGHFAFQEDYEVKLKKGGSLKADKSKINKYEVNKYPVEKYGKLIREKDPYFSYQELCANINNKMVTIHLAQSQSEVNSFAEVDLRPYIEKYKDVVYVQIFDTHVKDYEIRGTFQYVYMWCTMWLYEWKGNRIERNLECVTTKLMKVERNKTQEAGTPTIMKCRGCGNSVTLLDGKTCPCCGRQIDLIKYDWVIVEYQ